MIKWLTISQKKTKNRILLLVVYLTGLSLGVHQLNLLCIPVFILIYLYGTHKHKLSPLLLLVSLIGGLLIIVTILGGFMPGILDMASAFELYFVNRLQAPYFSGVISYFTLLFILIVISLIYFTITIKKDADYNRLNLISKKFLPILLLLSVLCFSGVFNFNNNRVVGLIISLLVTFSIYLFCKKPLNISLFSLWSLFFIIIGYSSFSLILIRGNASPPMNEGNPSDIFSFSSYISRDQYPTAPLLYGETPYSRPMLQEFYNDSTGQAVYNKYILEKGKAHYALLLNNPHILHRSNFVNEDESAKNNLLIKNSERGYILTDYAYKRKLTPELNMWFPRITSSNPAHLPSYEDWAGMNLGNMHKIKISETIDSSGRFTNKINDAGVREELFSYRPTYQQNLRYFLSYQTFYMYLRYLFWNFIGRQNDYPSTGEIEHGNFITGFPFIDNLMLGDQSLMPHDMGKNNAGYNRYFFIPFLFGLLGIIFLISKDRFKRRIGSVIFLLFLMTGLAIVVYLNQSPLEPRERDYSFLGSYYAFAIWIGIGMLYLYSSLHFIIKNRYFRTFLLVVISFSSPVILAVENYDDHDRSGRKETYIFSKLLLDNESPSIIFSYGDNSTFPLWHAQEVRGNGEEHSIIDLSYLTSPDYVVNLMKQGKKGIRLHASPSDILYGAFAFSAIPSDGLKPPLPLDSALKILYSNKTGNPEFPTSHVIIKNPGNNDSIILRLRDLTGNSSMLPFKNLMLLDIIASNIQSSNPKNLYFLNSVPTAFYRPFENILSERLYGRVLEFNSHAQKDSATNPEKPIQPIFIYDNEISEIQSAIDSLKKFSYIGYYTDPLIKDQQRRQRGAFIAAAARLNKKGLDQYSRSVSDTIVSIFPYSELSPGSYTVADTTYHEGLEYAFLLTERFINTSDFQDLKKARDQIEILKKESQKWIPYYNSLSANQKKAVSNSTLRLISILPRIKNLEHRLDSLQSL